jgi:hypothetical protein
MSNSCAVSRGLGASEDNRTWEMAREFVVIARRAELHGNLLPNQAAREVRKSEPQHFALPMRHACSRPRQKSQDWTLAASVVRGAATTMVSGSSAIARAPK